MPDPVEDQASSLRRLLGGAALHSALFVGGDSGIGQTALVAATAEAMARRGRSVLVVDGQPHLRSGAGWFGLAPRGDLTEALSGQRRLDEVVLHAAGGVTWAPAARLCPAGAGAPGAGRPDAPRSSGPAGRVLAELAARFDCVLIDVPADRADRWWPSAAYAGAVVLGSTCAARSITATYSALKMLALEVGQQRYLWWMGRTADPVAAEAAWSKVALTARRFLQVRVAYAGLVPPDAGVPRAQRLRRPLAAVFPASPAAAAGARLAAQLDTQGMDAPPPVPPAEAWHGLLFGELPLEAVPAQNRGGTPGDPRRAERRDTPQALPQTPPPFGAMGRTALVSR